MKRKQRAFFGKSKKKSKTKDAEDKEETPFKEDQKTTRRSSLKKVKPITQNPFEFLDTMLFDVSKVMEVKKSIGDSLPGRMSRKLKKKTWGQNMVEQIILFYKVIIFHQDCVKIVLDLIHNISTASNTRLDEIFARLKEQVKTDQFDAADELSGEVKITKDLKEKREDALKLDVVGESDSEYENKVRAPTNERDTEKRAQASRRVRALISSRRVRLFYFLLYNKYTITDNEIVPIKSKHPMSKFLKNFNKFIDNKARQFLQTPSEPEPRDEAKQIGELRRDMISNAGDNLSEWERMYLMSVIFKNRGGGTFFSPSGFLSSNFGAVDEKLDDFKGVERQIYEFACERTMVMLFDSGFRLNHKKLKQFVDEYTSLGSRAEENNLSTSRKAEDFITQMKRCTFIMKRGLFKRPLSDWEYGESVYEHVLNDAYNVRPVQLLKEIPDNPSYATRLKEALDRKTELFRACENLTVACMPELSVGRVMYFLMSHLLIIHRILVRLSVERLTAASGSVAYMLKKSNKDDYLKYSTRVSGTAAESFEEMIVKKQTTQPINIVDVRTMMVMDAQGYNLDQKGSDDVLTGFMDTRSTTLYRYSNEKDPHLNLSKHGLVPYQLKYNDFENLIHRVLYEYENMDSLITPYERVFMSYSLSMWSTRISSWRESLKLPLMSKSQTARYIRAKSQVRSMQQRPSTSFGLLDNLSKKHGSVTVTKTLLKLNKYLSPEQRRLNKKYVKYIMLSSK
uniref:Uncharacterized protein n=1 Tax=viral metagenome TaxID=1070528 RepID=A0A6C0FC40_9ZZZZ|tara:strand:- start:8354 stop:10564 length:2211 start_codon:yes stop_codon:yes gene_type:complete